MYERLLLDCINWPWCRGTEQALLSLSLSLALSLRDEATASRIPLPDLKGEMRRINFGLSPSFGCQHAIRQRVASIEETRFEETESNK